MKTLNFVLIFLCISMSMFSFNGHCQSSDYPAIFSWRNRFNTQQDIVNYISPAKDQGEQGPCGIFATVGAIEALSHIYYNKPFSASSVPNTLNLAEELENKIKNLPVKKNRSLQNERFFFWTNQRDCFHFLNAQRTCGRFKLRV